MQLYAGTKGKLGQKTRLSGAIAVSAPYEMKTSVERIERFGGFIDRKVLRNLQTVFLEHRDEPRYQKFLKQIKVDESAIRSARSLYEFDDNVSCFFFLGRKGVEELYDHFSGNRRLEHVEFPVLVDNSFYDPVVDGDSLDRAKILENENFFCCEVRDGGHVTYPHGCLLKNYSVMLAGKWIEVINAELG